MVVMILMCFSDLFVTISVRCFTSHTTKITMESTTAGNIDDAMVQQSILPNFVNNI